MTLLIQGSFSIAHRLIGSLQAVDLLASGSLIRSPAGAMALCPSRKSRQASPMACAPVAADGCIRRGWNDRYIENIALTYRLKRFILATWNGWTTITCCTPG